MTKLKLKLNRGKASAGWVIDATKCNVINLAAEVLEQKAIRAALCVAEYDVLSDYYDWLRANGVNLLLRRPTNAMVSEYYGVRPLWETEKSQGVVVRAEGVDDYYIVLECSSNVVGFRRTHMILTEEGCYSDEHVTKEVLNKAVDEYSRKHLIKSKYPCPCGSGIMFKECCGKIIE